MIYLDNAATTGTKPQSVRAAVAAALKELSANPGRGGYETSRKCAEAVYNCRKKVSDFFGASDPSAVVFTANCTQALNFVLKGVLQPGDHIIISSFEHNAVTRPTAALAERGVSFDVAEIVPGDDGAAVRAFRRLIKYNTKLIVCTHASNVTGDVLPIKEIGDMCRENGILFAVDAAQTAGILPINMAYDNIDYLCIAPHKGLYAPMGTGILIALRPIPFTIIEGGTGSASADQRQPSDPPERFESGTVNVPGIVGISAGIDFINSRGMSKIYNHEMQLARRFYKGLIDMGGTSTYSAYPKNGKHVPTVSFNLRGMPSEKAAAELGKHGVAVRAGLHCAPFAHKRIGTLDSGTVRVCFSAFNSENDVDAALRYLKMVKMQI